MVHPGKRLRGVRLGVVLAGLLLAPASTTAVARTFTTESAGTVKVAALIDATGKEVGTVAFTTDEDGQPGVTVITTALTPGEHGVHLHETGVCDRSGEKPFASAGAHVNPAKSAHGSHAGDLGNLTADAEGDALYSASGELTAELAAGLADEDGTALVIHATMDDLKTDPAGNSGARIACAVLFPGAGSTAVIAAGDPAGCTSDRVTFDELVALFANAPVTEPVIPSEVVIAIGKPADAATEASVKAIAEAIVACVNTGDFGKALAFFTPSAILAIFPWLGQEIAAGPEAMRASYESPQPIPVEYWQRVVAVTDVVVYADGRIGAMLVIDDPQSEPVRLETIHLILTRDDNRLLIDDAHYFSSE